MAPLAATHDFHPIYRLWFLWIDPILTVAGMYGNLLDHNTNAEAFFTDLVPDVHFKPFFYQIGGMGTSYLTLFVLLLRYTEDVNVWKIVQLAITWADFTMLLAIHTAMTYEGTLWNVAAWRVLDWFSIVITGGCTVLRIAFVLGIGVTPKKTAVKPGKSS